MKPACVLFLGCALSALAWFGLAATAEDGGGQGGFFWVKLVVPLGIATLALLITTVTLGLLVRRKPRVILRWHKRLGIATLVVALCHAGLVIILF
ncbi:MAG: hypothetical protein V2A58_14105 [Planctomycetota bacterium]